MKIDFYLRFHTKFGQSLAISGNLPVLGGDEQAKALPMSFLSDELWQASIEIDPAETDILQYRYIFIDENGEIKEEAEKERFVELKKAKHDFLLIDTWNDGSSIENCFYSAPFQEVFFKDHKKSKTKKNPEYTHQFKLKAPLLANNEVVCLLGSSASL